MNLDTNPSVANMFEFLDKALGVNHAYKTRIRNGINVQPSLSAFNNACQLLWLPSPTSKTREKAPKGLTGLSGQNYKIQNSVWEDWGNPNLNAVDSYKP